MNLLLNPTKDEKQVIDIKEDNKTTYFKSLILMNLN